LLKLKILFEDNHLIAVFKPPNLPTQKTHGHRSSLEEEVKAFIKIRDHKANDVYLHAIHRLDKAVSGIVLFAKTSKALNRLNEEMREGRIEKIYKALLEKAPPQKEGTLKHFLKHGDFKSEVSNTKKEGYKEAILDYEADQLKVMIKLKTGRYHQIRAQFGKIGCPIQGDIKYGAKQEGIVKLMHTKLTLTHPTTKELIVIEVPLEEWFS
jgi:23S rRNA pseudouridine1911/1915/1917 synthase